MSHVSIDVHNVTKISIDHTVFDGFQTLKVRYTDKDGTTVTLNGFFQDCYNDGEPVAVLSTLSDAVRNVESREVQL